MDVKLIYPIVDKQRLFRQKLTFYSQWIFILIGLASVIVNLILGGKAWSVIVIWSLRMVWSQLIYTDMVEYNRLSQTVKLIKNSCILLGLIDIFLASGWSVNVIAIISFSALVLIAILFLTDFKRQKQNMFPMLSFSLLSFLGSIVGLIWQQNPETYWPLIVMCVNSFSLLLICIILLRRGFWIEMKKRFSLR